MKGQAVQNGRIEPVLTTELGMLFQADCIAGSSYPSG